MTYTLEEQENLAYMSGDTKTAKLLGFVIDYLSNVDEYSISIERKKAYDEGYATGYGDGQRSMM